MPTEKSRPAVIYRLVNINKHQCSGLLPNNQEREFVWHRRPFANNSAQLYTGRSEHSGTAVVTNASFRIKFWTENYF